MSESYWRSDEFRFKRWKIALRSNALPLPKSVIRSLSRAKASSLRRGQVFYDANGGRYYVHGLMKETGKIIYQPITGGAEFRLSLQGLDPDDTVLVIGRKVA